MKRILQPAVPGCLALIAGTGFALEAGWCPPGLATALLALGLALDRSWGRDLAFLAVGLISGCLQTEPGLRPLSDRPVSMRVEVTGAWRMEEEGLRVAAQGRWIRQGLRVARWNRQLHLVLPRGADPPESLALKVTGYLRRPVAPANGGSASPGPWILRVKSRSFVTDDAGSSGSLTRVWHRLGRVLRKPIESRLSRNERNAVGLQGTDLVRVLVLGQTRRLPDAVARGLRAAGLAHLVALSGLHVGLLVGSGMILTSWAPLKCRFAVAIFLALAYVLLAGFRPSLWRATLMMIAFMASWQLRRPAQPLNVLSWVAAGMAVAHPRILDQLGFQLTVAATTGILVLAPRFQRQWTLLPVILRRPLSVSVAAHLAVLPWALSEFHLATPFSPWWNLIAVPWAALALTFAFLWVLCCLLVPPLESSVRQILDLVAVPLEVFGTLPPTRLGAIPVDFSGWSAWAVAIGLACLLLMGGWKRVVAGVVTTSLVVLNMGSQPSGSELVVLDVGQGEAILLRDGSTALLIDGGGWRRADIAQQILLGALTRIGVHRLAGMVLSHPDTDHCGGLLALSSYMSVPRLYLSPGWLDDPCVAALLTRPGLEIRSLWRGEQFRSAGWNLRVLHPGPGSRTGRNNRSLVLLAETGGKRILLTGDLEAGGEREILATLEPRELRGVDVLKIGHHGSQTSTSAEWLDRLQPRVALISCGVANRYGHPHPMVLKRLIDRRVTTLRTDSLGALHLSFGPGDRIQLSLPGQPRVPGG